MFHNCLLVQNWYIYSEDLEFVVADVLLLMIFLLQDVKFDERQKVIIVKPNMISILFQAKT